MENESLLYYGRHGETILHPTIAVAILIAGALIFLMRQKYVLVPLLCISILIPLGQRVVIFGLDFTLLRIMIFFGWLRLILSSENQKIKLTEIDKVFIFWALSNVICFTLLWQTWGAFVNRIGFAYNAIGVYFLYRYTVRNLKDIDLIVKSLALISVIVAISMIAEQVSGRNAFSIFGGVPEITPLREGRLRSQGAFAHPILAGTFGATMIPLFVSFWWQGRRKKFAIFSIIAASIITITSSSSGPLLTYFAGIFGLCMWPLRKHMRKIMCGIFLSLIVLHIIMKAPVWALIWRIGIFAGSSAYHRFYLFDQFLRRVDEWWLFGTKSTDHWGWMMWDTQNEYVSQGVEGGILTLILFIIIISLCFRAIGLKLISIKHRTIQLFLWSFGASLFAHMIALMGMSYFDQTILIWYTLLAAISTISNLSDRTIYAKVKDLDRNYVYTEANHEIQSVI